MGADKKETSHSHIRGRRPDEGGQCVGTTDPVRSAETGGTGVHLNGSTLTQNFPVEVWTKKLSTFDSLSRRLHERYVSFVSGHDKNQRVMTYVTFLKYCNAYHVDVAIQRAKEDACDTCIRLTTALADPNLSSDEKEMLLEPSALMHPTPVPNVLR
jgi:hypothetical protein